MSSRTVDQETVGEIDAELAHVLGLRFPSPAQLFYSHLLYFFASAKKSSPALFFRLLAKKSPLDKRDRVACGIKADVVGECADEQQTATSDAG